MKTRQAVWYATRRINPSCSKSRLHATWENFVLTTDAANDVCVDVFLFLQLQSFEILTLTDRHSWLERSNNQEKKKFDMRHDYSLLETCTTLKH